MRISNRVVFTTIAALRALDGTKESPIKLSGLTQLAIAHNLRRLSERASDLEKARKKIAEDVGFTGIDLQAKIIPPETLAAFRKFESEWTNTLNGTTDIVITRFTTDDLNLEKNEIPRSVVSDLLWITELKEEPPK
jgi:hypothetical protein